MAQCDLGYVLFQGYCVPSHYTQAEKEEFVRRKQKAKKRTPIAIAALVVIAGALWFAFNVL